MPDCLSLCCLSGGQEDGGRWAGLTNDVHIEWKMLSAPTQNTLYTDRGASTLGHTFYGSQVLETLVNVG